MERWGEKQVPFFSEGEERLSNRSRRRIWHFLDGYYSSKLKWGVESTTCTIGSPKEEGRVDCIQCPSIYRKSHLFFFSTRKKSTCCFDVERVNSTKHTILSSVALHTFTLHLDFYMLIISKCQCISLPTTSIRTFKDFLSLWPCTLYCTFFFFL